MVVLDVIILIIWSLRDPLKKKSQKLNEIFIENEDIMKVPEIEICKANNDIVWIGMKKKKFMKLNFGSCLTELKFHETVTCKLVNQL